MNVEQGTELREAQRAVQSQGFLIQALQEHIASLTVDLANARAELAMTRAATVPHPPAPTQVPDSTQETTDDD